MTDVDARAIRALRPEDGWAAGAGGRRTWAAVEARLAAGAAESRTPLITRRRALVGGALVAGGGVAAALLPGLIGSDRPRPADLFAQLPADPSLARQRFRTLTELVRASMTVIRARVRAVDRLGPLTDHDGDQADLIGLTLDPTTIIGDATAGTWVVQFRAPAGADPLPVPAAEGVWFLEFPSTMADAPAGTPIGQWLTNDQGLFLAEGGRLRNPIGPADNPLIAELSALPDLDDLIERVERVR